MQYQEILLTINIFFIILIVVLIKDGYRRKFFIASTICAYVLAAILPYLLTWSSLNVTILFYVLVIGLISFFAYDQYKSVIGSTYADAVSSDKAGSIGEAGIPAIEKSVMQSEPSTDEIEAKAEADLEDKGELPSHNGAEQTPAEIIHIDEHKMELKTVHKEEPEEAADEAESVLPDDVPAAAAAPPRDAEIDIHTVEEPGEPEVALPDDIPAAVAASPADTEAEPMSDDFKDRMDEELDTLAAYDIETLIELAFAARARGDYYRTLTILEKILEQDPPEEMVNLILDDVEVLFAKLVS